MVFKKKIKIVVVISLLIFVSLTIFFLLRREKSGEEYGIVLPEGLLSEAKKVVYSETKGERIVFKLKAKKSFSGDGREIFEDILGLYFDRKKKKPQLIVSKRCENDLKRGKIVFKENVKIFLSGNIKIYGSEFIYKKNECLIYSPKKFSFVSENMEGKGNWCEIGLNEDTLTFRKNFKISIVNGWEKNDVSGKKAIFYDRKKIIHVIGGGRIKGEKIDLSSENMEIVLGKNNAIKEIFCNRKNEILVGSKDKIEGDVVKVTYGEGGIDKIESRGKSRIVIENGKLNLKGEELTIRLKGNAISSIVCGNKNVCGLVTGEEGERYKIKGDMVKILLKDGTMDGIFVDGNGEIDFSENKKVVGKRLELNLKGMNIDNIVVKNGRMESEEIFVYGDKLQIYFNKNSMKRLLGQRLTIERREEKEFFSGERGEILFSNGKFDKISLKNRVMVKGEKYGVMKGDSLVAKRKGMGEKLMLLFTGNFVSEKDDKKIFAKTAHWDGESFTYEEVKIRGQKYSISSDHCILKEKNYKFSGNVIFNSKDGKNIITSDKLGVYEKYFLFVGRVRLINDFTTLKCDNLKMSREKDVFEGRGSVIFISKLKNGSKIFIRSEKISKIKEKYVFSKKVFMSFGDISTNGDIIVYEMGGKEDVLRGKGHVLVNTSNFRATGDRLSYFVKEGKMSISGRRVKVINKEDKSTSIGKRVLYFEKEGRLKIE